MGSKKKGKKEEKKKEKKISIYGLKGKS